MMNVEEIMSIIPHRYPFLLIDKIEEMVPGEKVVAVKNVHERSIFSRTFSRQTCYAWCTHY